MIKEKIIDFIEQINWYAEKYLVPTVLAVTGFAIIIKFIQELV